jgi:hypothetical protein
MPAIRQYNDADFQGQVKIVNVPNPTAPQDVATKAYVDGISLTGGVPSFQYSQNIASAVWTITHNLPFYPNVSVVDSAGTQIFPGTVQYPNATQVVLTFSSAVGGFAYLS